MIAAYALTGSTRQGRVRLYVIRLGGSAQVTECQGRLRACRSIPRGAPEARGCSTRVPAGTFGRIR